MEAVGNGSQGGNFSTVDGHIDYSVYAIFWVDDPAIPDDELHTSL
jgi:hypothetical protein